MKKRAEKTVPINWIDDTERYIVVPRMLRSRTVKKLKLLIKVKGNCYFTKGVPYGIIDFIYRAVIKLGLRERKLIFSRGSVKRKKDGGAGMEICELDWDLGTSFIIPMRMRYDAMIDISIYGSRTKVRTMEIIVLAGLLGLVHPDRSFRWRSALAAAIVTHGWSEIKKKDPPRVFMA